MRGVLNALVMSMPSDDRTRLLPEHEIKLGWLREAERVPVDEPDATASASVKSRTAEDMSGAGGG